jgi:hypothetical protein
MADDRPIDDGYVEVSQRIEKFKEEHPNGSLQSTWTIEKIPAPHDFRRNEKKQEHGNCRQCGLPLSDVGGENRMCEFWGFIVRAEAFRDPDDDRPGVGTAWEPFPGRTPYTRHSELMNAETSAWGRALASLGYEVHNGSASANEMRGRDGGGEGGHRAPSEGQVSFYSDLVKETDLPAATQANVIAYGKAELSGGKNGSMSKAIDGLKDKSSRTEVAQRLATAAEKWANAAETDGSGKQPDSGGEQPPQEA